MRSFLKYGPYCFFLIVLVGCTSEKEPLPALREVPTMGVQSSKSLYGIGQAPAFDFINITSRRASYNVCSSIEGPPYFIEKLNNGVWEPFTVAYACDAFISGCCEYLAPSSTTRFTYQNLSWFVSGTYRYIFQIAFLDPDTGRKATYSNSFQIIR